MMIKSAVALLVVLVAFASYWPAISADSDEERFKYVFATDDQGPKGSFEETKSQLQELWNTIMQNPENPKDPADKEMLDKTTQGLRTLVAICEFDQAKCATVFNDIEEIRSEINGNLINLVPYVKTCEEQQRQFCNQ